ncbi:hypothetical protein JCM10908_000220 [Rhodotorula pacifica]|uniref:uncharacterized protein n=1 Tax=Rhodotorula pacifica TaxID=1495444 RepID=UPI00317CE6E8
MDHSPASKDAFGEISPPFSFPFPSKRRALVRKSATHRQGRSLSTIPIAQEETASNWPQEDAGRGNDAQDTFSNGGLRFQGLEGYYPEASSDDLAGPSASASSDSEHEDVRRVAESNGRPQVFPSRGRRGSYPKAAKMTRQVATSQRTTYDLSPEEAYYFMRELVGQELDEEARESWSLDRIVSGLTSATSVETTPHESPLLTYLIRHFLLTLPIVRDEVDADENPVFWSAGLRLLLHALHDADLSLPVERGVVAEDVRPAFRGALERFVAAGLKLSSQTFGASPEISTSSPTVEKGSLATDGATVQSGRNRAESIPVMTKRQRQPSSDTSPASVWTRRFSLPRVFGFRKSSQQGPAKSARHTPPPPRLSARAPRVAYDSTTVSEGESGDDINVVAAMRSEPFSKEPQVLKDHPQPLSFPPPPVLPAIQSPSPLRSPEIERPEPTHRASGVSMTDAQSFVTAETVLASPSLVTTRDTSADTEPNVASSAYDGIIQSDQATQGLLLPPPLPSVSLSGSSIGSGSGEHSPSIATITQAVVVKNVGQPAPLITASPLPDQYGTPTTLDRTSRPKTVLPPTLVPRQAVAEPFGSEVDFRRGASFDKIRWGGFEVDLIGKIAPHALIPKLPAGAPKNDAFIAPKRAPGVLDGTSTVTSPPLYMGTIPDGEAGSSTPRSRFFTGLQAAARDSSAGMPVRPPLIGSGGSIFARSLRAQSTLSLADQRSAYRRSRASSFSTVGPRRPVSTSASIRSYQPSVWSRVSARTEPLKKPPTRDGRRRVVRAWLRDVLSVSTVRRSREALQFLLEDPRTPRDKDVLDILDRQAIDDARRQARAVAGVQAIGKAYEMQQHWAELEHDIVFADGLDELSDTLRLTPTLQELTPRYRRAVEKLRLDIATWLFRTLVASPSATSNFDKLSRLHAALPWGKLRTALRVSSSNKMVTALQNALLSSRLGSKTLLQRLISIALDDDPLQIAQQLDALRTRIGSAIMTEKLELYVNEPRQKKAIIRTYAKEHDAELVLCIVRGADEPHLPQFELDRVAQAQKAYRAFANAMPSAQKRAEVRDPDIRLVLDLQNYLALVSKERDGAMIRSLLGQEDVASAIEVVAQPLIELLRRSYKVGNLAQLLTSLEALLDRLLVVVEALRHRTQDPEKGIRAIAKVLEQHQAAFYSFLHGVHKEETIVEEFLQWAWTAAIFLRRGLARPIDLDALVPPSRRADKAALLSELERLVSYYRSKGKAEYETTVRCLAGEVDADDPILVEGDGRGRARTEPIPLGTEEKRPTLREIPRYAKAFKEQLKAVFAV